MVNASAATESLLKHIKPLWMFPALILTACGVEPRLPGPVVREEVGNIQDLAQFDRVPQQVLNFQQVSNFNRSAYNGPLGIDTAMDTSDVVEELRGSRIDFVARYYRDPTSSLPGYPLPSRSRAGPYRPTDRSWRLAGSAGPAASAGHDRTVRSPKISNFLPHHGSRQPRRNSARCHD